MSITWRLCSYECVANLSYGGNGRDEIWTWQAAQNHHCCPWCCSVFLWQLSGSTRALPSSPVPRMWDPGIYHTYWWMLKLIWSFFKLICTRVQFCFPCRNTGSEEAEACHGLGFGAPYLRDWQPFEFPIASVEISLVIKDGSRVWGRCLNQ